MQCINRGKARRGREGHTHSLRPSDEVSLFRYAFNSFSCFKPSSPWIVSSTFQDKSKQRSLGYLRRGGGRRGKGCHGRATATNALTWCTLPWRGHPRCRSRGRGGPMRTHCCPLALPGWPAGRTRTQAGVGAHATVVDQGGTVTTASALMRVPGRLSSSLGSGVPGTGDGLGEGLGPLRGLLARGSALAAPARMPPESCKNGHGHPAACVGARVRAALQRPCGW